MHVSQNQSDNGDHDLASLDRTFDFAILGPSAEADAEQLYLSAEAVYEDVQDLANDQDWEPAQNIINNESEVPRSEDELIAQLNGIAATAYRLARRVRPLMDARALHLACRAEREAQR